MDPVVIVILWTILTLTTIICFTIWFAYKADQLEKKLATMDRAERFQSLDAHWDSLPNLK